MADIALVTANKVEVVQSIEQHTAPTDEAVVAGAPVRLNVAGTAAAGSRFTNANAGSAPEARVYGLATATVPAGGTVTAIKKGVMDGFNLDSQAYDLPIFLSNTDGRIADAAGTVSTVIGRVIGGHGQSVGVAPDKLLLIDL